MSRKTDSIAPTPTMALCAMAIALILPGCASHMPGSGPSAESLVQSAPVAGIQVMDLNVESARAANQKLAASADLAAEFGGAGDADLRVNPGDSLEVSIWEAPPAALFVTSMLPGTHLTSLPAQVVQADGEITVPFVGRLKAAGKTTKEIEAEIVKRLSGKAHLPQALVRIASNASSDVTVVGEVARSVRVPVTPRGERLLDAIAAAGGPKAPVEKVLVKLTRADVQRAVPLESVIRDHAQNVRLLPGDVITVYHQPTSFTAMGAVARPGEVAFEATGITLAQAVARVGGALDERANPEGVFLFRRGEPPVVYRVDMRDPAAIIAMREFKMLDGDILYVANAPAAELQKFMSVAASVVNPVTAIRK